MSDERFDGKRKMHIIMELTDAQWSAMESLFSQWNWLGGDGTSRWTAFYADGDGNFKPHIRVGKEGDTLHWPKHSTLIPSNQCWVRGEYRMDYDRIAWPLHHGSEYDDHRHIWINDPEIRHGEICTFCGNKRTTPALETWLS